MKTFLGASIIFNGAATLGCILLMWLTGHQLFYQGSVTFLLLFVLFFEAYRFIGAEE